MSETGRTRSVVAKGARVPWPRRLLAAGLLSGVLALALHALPRPYQQIPTGVVRGLGDSYGNLRSSYQNEVAALEPVTGEASEADRKAYARELWRYRWWGSFKEILLRFAEWFAASCLFLALGLIVVERRRTRRAMASRTGETLLRHETLAGVPLAMEKETAPSPVVTPLRVEGGAIPLRETGEEVTPPSPTPIPVMPPAFELRLAVAPEPFDDDDLGRPTESQAPNLAKRAVPGNVTPAVAAGPVGLPVFFAERKHPDPHPVVHPGDSAPPSEPAPTPPPTSATPVVAAPVTPTPTPVLSSAPITPEATPVAPSSDAPPAITPPNDNPGWWPKRGDS